MPLVCHWWLSVLVDCGSWPRIPPLGHLSHNISVTDKDCDACNKKGGFKKIHGVFVSVDSAMIAWSLSLSVDLSLTDASARWDLRYGLEPTLCLVRLWKGVCTCPSRIQQARARLSSTSLDWLKSPRAVPQLANTQRFESIWVYYVSHKGAIASFFSVNN